MSNEVIPESIAALLFFWGAIAAYLCHINSDDNASFAWVMGILFVAFWSISIVFACNIYHDKSTADCFSQPQFPASFSVDNGQRPSYQRHPARRLVESL